MKKKTIPARKRTARAVSPAPIPPLVFALAHLTDPELEGLHLDFVRAWRRMPQIIDAYMKHTHNDLGVVSADSVMGDIFRENIDRSRKEADSFNKSAKAYDLLEEADEDYADALYGAMQSPAFNTGLALGLFLALNGGGAR